MGQCGELGGGDSELAKGQNRQLPSKLRRLPLCLLATNGDNHLRKKAWKFLCKVKCNTIRSQLLQGKSPGNEVWKRNFRQMFGDMQMLRQGLLRPYQNIPSIGGWGVVVVRFKNGTSQLPRASVSSRASRMTAWERIYQNGGQGSRCCSGS